LKIKLIDGSIRDAGIEKGWQYYFKRFFLKMANSIIANSYAGLNAYQVNGNVIYNAINYDRFLKNTGVAEFNIVMTANFTDYKDHKTFLIASIELVNAKIVDNVFLLGDGSHRSKHRDWLNNTHPEISSRFIFAGAVKNVEEFLSKCKVGILCSTIAFKEGVSNAVLEYMAAGLVAIATDVGGAREVINHEENGFLVEPGNSNAIVKTIIRIKDQQIDSNSIVTSAMNTIRTKFSFKSNINELLNIYKNTVN
jgi:glycosyltransferase involved in cell wall biosynthesis